MRLAALYVALQDMDYLESSLRSVLPFVETILIGVCSSRKIDLISLQAITRGLGGSSAVSSNPAVLDGARPQPLSSAIRCIEGKWQDDVECRNALLQQMQAEGMTHVLLMEPEDVLAASDLVRMLEFVKAHPESGQFLAPSYDYWKSPSYRIDPPSPELRVLVSRITSRTRTLPGNRTDEQPAIAFPESARIHRFAFASSSKVVKKRVTAMPMAADARRQWEQQVWQAWDDQRGQWNLHPVAPDRFREAQRINLVTLPEALCGHPYLQFEVVGGSRRPAPVFSVLFRAGVERAAVEALLANLARTAPDLCEWIACVSEPLSEAAEFLSRKPGVKLAVTGPQSRSLSPTAEWCDGVAMAEGEILVFLGEHLQFEGDWLEGIQAAIGNSPQAGPQNAAGQGASVVLNVYVPRIAHLEPEDKPLLTGGPHTSLTERDWQFEQTRGRFYGELSPLEPGLDLRELLCWSCSRKDWTELCASLEPREREPKLLDSASALPQANLAGFSRGGGDAKTALVSGYFVDDTVVFSPSAIRPRAAELQPESHKTETRLVGLSESAPLKPHTLHTSTPAVSIVIPVFNNLSLTQQCLDSIFQNTTPGLYEVIVVDNGSTDGTREFMQSLEPRIRYIRNMRNLFFARGCNRGAWAAQADNVLFLNNDTVVKPNWLEAMLAVLEESPEIGIVGNKQLFPASNPIYSSLVWHAGMAFTEDKDSWHVFFGLDAAHPAVNEQRDCPCVTGCCLLIRKALFQRLRGFDPWFQNGYEDTDLCLRAGQLGARIVYTPRSEIVHHVSASESRFDRHAANFLRFRERWAERIVPSEIDCYRKAGLLVRDASKPRTKEKKRPAPATQSTGTCRVGFVSAFNQQSAFAGYANQLLAEFPPGSFFVLSDYAVHSRLSQPDPDSVIRCWDPSASWLQPLARWIHALEAEVLHVNLDLEILAKGFLTVLKGARERGKNLVVTLHSTSPPSTFLGELCDEADGVIVHSKLNRMELILNGCEASKIHVVTPGVLFTPLAGTGGVPNGQPDYLLREKLRLGVFSKIVATPGFVSRRKGIHEVISSLASARSVLDIHYLVLGAIDPADPDSAGYLQECKALVRQHCLEHQVTFVERYLSSAEMRKFLLCADAVVLAYQAGRPAWSSAAALALSLGRAVVTSGDPMFLELGDAVLRATGGLSLAQAMVSVLTNPFLAGELRRRAGEYAAAHNWKDCAAEHWRIYHAVQGRAERPPVSPFVEYRRWTAGAIRPIDAEKLLPQLRAWLSGKVIEFASRSLELTEAIQPEASVSAQDGLAALAKLAGAGTTFLSLDEFRASAFANQVFDSVLLHLSEGVEPCAELVRALLPHFSSQQKLVLVFDAANRKAHEIARQFESHDAVTRSQADRIGSLQLLEFRSQNLSGALSDRSALLLRAEAGTSRCETPPGHSSVNLASDDPFESIAQAKGVEALPHVCWEGPQLVNHSLALVNREFEHGLLSSGCVRLSILPMGADNFSNQLGSRDRRLRQHYAATRSAPVHIHVRHQWPPNWAAPPEGHFVVIQPWEYGSLPAEWVRQINDLVDEAWVPSTFVRSLYVQSGIDPNRVYVVPNGVNTARFTPEASPLPIQSVKKFRFLFVGGTIARKGIDLLLEAYRRSFTRNDDVALVIKDMGASSIYQGQGFADRIRQLCQDPNAPEIVYLDRDLSAEDMAGLYTACHCLVHPYRGEGFALPVLEAMSCRLPVVVTAGGATDDFVDDAVGYRIPARKQVFGDREISGLKTAGDLWMLEPDSQKLAETLAHVFRHRPEAQEKGRLARRRAETEWTWERATQRALERILHLYQKPVLRHQRAAECAVLVSIPDVGALEAIRATLLSLLQNSYAFLRIYLRPAQKSSAVDTLAREFPEVTLANGDGFSSAVEQIHREVRAPYLALVSAPLRFSKQWLSQIAAVVQRVGSDAIVVPSVDLEGAAHYVCYEGNGDERSFQKFSRELWRSQRSKFQLLESVPEGCAVLSWSCLERESGQFSSAEEWLQKLRDGGVPAYWALDTFVGQLR